MQLNTAQKMKKSLMENFIFCAVRNDVSKTFKRQVINSVIPGKEILWGEGR